MCCGWLGTGAYEQPLATFGMMNVGIASAILGPTLVCCGTATVVEIC